MRSAAVGLRCVDCARSYSLDYLRGCPDCGGLVFVEYDLGRVAELRLGDGGGGGIWRWDELLPPTAPEHRVTLGEGMSPLVRATRLAERLGVREVHLKVEGVNPTGSMKDRSSVTAIAAAQSFGFGRVGCVSSGNMGSSIANYAARAGLRAFVFSAAYASEAQVDHMAAGTADMYVYDGPYDAMAAAIQPIFDEGLAFDAGSSANPYNSEGQKTLAFEIVEQLGGRGAGRGDVSAGGGGPVPGGDARVRAVGRGRLDRSRADSGGGAELCVGGRGSGNGGRRRL